MNTVMNRNKHKQEGTHFAIRDIMVTNEMTAQLGGGENVAQKICSCGRAVQYSSWASVPLINNAITESTHNKSRKALKRSQEEEFRMM